MGNITPTTQNDSQLSTNIQKQTGIWYSTWYANKGAYHWITGHGIGSSSQMLGDVDGDGKDDAIVYFAQTGEWYASLSNGNGFNGFTRWIGGHGIGSSKQMLADVNGDRKDDAVVYFARTGEWYVSLSNGKGFNGFRRWTGGHGIGSNNQILADVNGDGRADAVVYFAQTGEWYVSLSNGNGFNRFTRWSRGYGSGSNAQMLADVNGDRRADAVVYFANTGEWHVSLSNGNGFNPSIRWIRGHGIGSTRQMLGDVDGDGKADAVVYFGQKGVDSGSWYVARSNGKAFDNFYLWKVEHGQPSKYNNDKGSSWQGLGKIYGHTSAYAPVVFSPHEGQWRALPPDKYSKPNIMNTWEAWDIKYRPYTLGEYRAYDTQEAAVIDEHLRMITKAGIDFLIFDLTNTLDTDEGYITEGAKVVAERIRIWNSNKENTPVKYAIAVGGMQYTGNPRTLEQEANSIWNQFIDYFGTDNYYHLDGKPLLVSYSTYTQRDRWTTARINKSATSRFNLQWAQGSVPYTENKRQVPLPSEYGSYLGWGYPQGSLPNKDVMVVMPGWNNRVHMFTSRYENGVEGNFYSIKGWERVLAQQPRMVIINSFNEYLEHTGVAPADTSGVTDAFSISLGQRWSNPDFYWNMTVEYNKQYKGIQ